MKATPSKPRTPYLKRRKKRDRVRLIDRLLALAGLSGNQLPDDTRLALS